MYSLPIKAVTDWIKHENFWLPQSIDFVCPHCGRKVNFGVLQWRYDNNQRTAVASAKCSGCRDPVRFWALDPVKYGDTRGRECKEVCMHPTPEVERQPMSGLDKVPSPVAKAYVSAINVFNAKEWNATAVVTGRALEGLVKSLMPEDKKTLPLAKMLAALPQEIDLVGTLTTLVDGLRKGRNLGAHFDLEKEADWPVAEMMINLLEYFLEYLYILPRQVEALHKEL